MHENNIKYFQIVIRVDEKLILNRFKEFLNDANLHYVYTYNPRGLYWQVFIDCEGEDMKKIVESKVKLFIETERYANGDKLYERMWK